MIVKEKIKFKDYPNRQVEILLRGSGDPTEEHDIVWVEIQDAEGNRLYGVGDINATEESPQVHGETIAV